MQIKYGRGIRGSSWKGRDSLSSMYGVPQQHAWWHRGTYVWSTCPDSVTASRVEPATCRSRVRRPNHYTTEPQLNTDQQTHFNIIDQNGARSSVTNCYVGQEEGNFARTSGVSRGEITPLVCDVIRVVVSVSRRFWTSRSRHFNISASSWSQESDVCLGIRLMYITSLDVMQLVQLVNVVFLS